MATKIIMPKQGLQMTEGTIIHWLVGEGDAIAVGQPLFEMETDKVTITIDALVAGTLLKIVRAAGETVPITETIGIMGEPGEDYAALLTPTPAVDGDVATPQAAMAREAPTPSPSAAPGGFASPRARSRAEERGIDLSHIVGSAADGMVIERDVMAVASAQPKATPLARKTAEQAGIDPASLTGSGPHGKVDKADILAARGGTAAGRDIRPFRGMRKIIAQRMKRSQNENAQTTHRVRVRMTEAARCRESLKAAGTPISFNDLIALSCVRSLLEHPRMNVELTEGGIWHKDFVNLGIAVALDEGLIVPVIKNAEAMTLSRLSSSIKEAAKAARDGMLPPDAVTGGSFTISNLGMYGLDEFTAIINPPEAGILAVGKITPTPLAINDRVEIHPVMTLTLSYDHRVVDGAPAAQFLCAVRDCLENPYRLL